MPQHPVVLKGTSPSALFWFRSYEGFLFLRTIRFYRDNIAQNGARDGPQVPTAQALKPDHSEQRGAPPWARSASGTGGGGPAALAHSRWRTVSGTSLTKLPLAGSQAHMTFGTWALAACTWRRPPIDQAPERRGQEACALGPLPPALSLSLCSVSPETGREGWSCLPRPTSSITSKQALPEGT